MFNFVKIQDTFKSGTKYNRGWLLEVKSPAELIQWYKRDDDIMNILHDLKSPYHNTHKMADFLEIKTALINEKTGQDKFSIVDLCEIYADARMSSKLKVLKKYGTIYINSVGGFSTLGSGEIVERAKNKNLQYPEIGVEFTQFPNGTHFYIKQGNMSLIIDGVEKWDTKEEAENAFRESQDIQTKSKKDLFND